MAKLTQSKNLQFTSLNTVTDELIRIANDNRRTYGAYDEGFFAGLTTALYALGVPDDQIPDVINSRPQLRASVDPVGLERNEVLSAAMEARLAEMQQETLDGVDPIVGRQGGYNVIFDGSFTTSSGTMVCISTPGESNE